MATKKPAAPLSRKERRHAALVVEVEGFKAKYKTDFDDPVNASSPDAALKADVARIEGLIVAYEQAFGETFDPQVPPKQKADWLNGRNVAIAGAACLAVIASILAISFSGTKQKQARVPQQQEQAKAPAPPPSPAPAAVAPAPAPVAQPAAPAQPAPVAAAPVPAPAAVPLATPPSPPAVLTEEKIQKMIADGIAAGLKAAPQPGPAPVATATPAPTVTPPATAPLAANQFVGNDGEVWTITGGGNGRPISVPHLAADAAKACPHRRITLAPRGFSSNPPMSKEQKFRGDKRWHSECDWSNRS